MQILEDSGKLDEFGDPIMVAIDEASLEHLEYLADGELPAYEIVQEAAITKWEEEHVPQKSNEKTNR